MTPEQQLQENLLYAWMEMSVFIRRNRIMADLSFNEVMICGMLYRQQKTDPPLTATELGERTNLLKSQINHILTNMEQRGLIERTRSTTDKRVVYVQLSEEGRQTYAREHTGVMEILKAVHEEFGSEKTRELTNMLKKATSIVNNYMDPNATSKEN
jgi:DNA-binding MarR family transcriptional regulator